MEAQIYLGAIRRWWWLLVLGPVVAAASAFLYSKSLTPIYQAEATLLVNQTQNPGVLQYNDVLTSERLTNTYAELVERQPILSQVIEDLDLALAEATLASRISVSAVRNTQLLRIAVEDSDPALAAEIANTTAAVFIDKNASELGSPGTVRVAEQAQVPTRPAKPDVRLNTVMAAILGLMVVGALAVLLEYLDDTVKPTEDTETSLGVPTLGVVRQLKVDAAYGATLARMREEEAYAQLRTNVHFAGLGKPLKKLVVTGSSPGEGKSTTAAGLAMALAESGEKVILVDTDLRRPTLHRVFGVRNSVGLTGLLLSNTFDPGPLLADTVHPNLKLVTSGPLPANPAELLMSVNMQRIIDSMCEKASYVVFDTPPVLSVADARILAGIADATIVVCSAGHTRRQALRRALADLRLTHGNIMGLVINKAKGRSTEYGYDYYAADQSGSRLESEPRLEPRVRIQEPVPLRPDETSKSANG
jgi:succinoglycan biosynthesis transport protein ExoP